MEYSGSAVNGDRMDIRLELALITAGELLVDIRNASMRIVTVWGEYDLSPWDEEYSPRLLVLAERIE